jgi:hypothetical protein
MIRFYPNEQFKEIAVPSTLKMRYAISNAGRLLSFTENFQDGRILNPGKVDGYKVFNYKIRKEDGKYSYKHLYYFRLVAEYFIPKPSEAHTYVLHLDFSRDNDTLNNLRWATREEQLVHYRKSPRVIQAKKDLIEHNIKSDGRKLDSTKVIRIKKMLTNPNRTTRIKMIAKLFGVSEMQIHRIQRGENWGHIKI